MFVLKKIHIFPFLGLVILIFAQCTKKTSAEFVQDGRDLTKNARYEEAFSAFKRATELNPLNPDAHYGLGGIYNQKGKYPAAAKAFLTALELDPTYLDAYYSLGYTYETMGNKEEAQIYFLKYQRLKEKFTRLLKKEKLKP